MKFAVLLDYSHEDCNLLSVHEAQREYMSMFRTNGQLRAVGEFAGESGAIWIIDATNLLAAETIVAECPSVQGGCVERWSIRPLASWAV